MAEMTGPLLKPAHKMARKSFLQSVAENDPSRTPVNAIWFIRNNWGLTMYIILMNQGSNFSFELLALFKPSSAWFNFDRKEALVVSGIMFWQKKVWKVLFVFDLIPIWSSDYEKKRVQIGRQNLIEKTPISFLELSNI